MLSHQVTMAQSTLGVKKQFMQNKVCHVTDFIPREMQNKAKLKRKKKKKRLKWKPQTENLFLHSFILRPHSQ